MSGTRVYVASSWSGLRTLVTSDGLGPAPFAAHAVTPALQEAYADGGEEEWEYAAMAAAARTSLGLLADDDAPRRVVIAVDAEGVVPVDSEDPTEVEVGEVVPFRRVAAVLVDSADAEADVAAAIGCWADAEAGDEAAEATVERCSERELAWYANQEIGDLLAP